MLINSIYDGSGSRLRLTYPAGNTVSFTPDILNRINEVKKGTDTIADYSYIGSGYRILNKTLGNDIALDAEYDELRRATRYHWHTQSQTILDIQHAYDREDNKHFEKFVHTDKADVFNYDPIYRLTAVKYGVPEGQLGNWNNQYTIPFEQLDSERIIEYNMDGVGNRESVIEDSVETAYVPNCMNEYEHIDSVAQEHDPNGNLTFDGQHRYYYDYANRLCEVRDAEGTETIALYWYDVLGRRITTYVNDVTTDYYYDGVHCIEERNGAGAMSRQHFVGIGTDEWLMTERSDGGQYWYHQNTLGSVMAVMNQDSVLLETVEYDVYGTPEVTQHNGAAPTHNRFLFTGREYDAETGLYWYRARHYNPTTGRFLQRDPLLMNAIQLSFVDSKVILWSLPPGRVIARPGRFYSYAENNPPNLVDPRGLHPWLRVSFNVVPANAKCCVKWKCWTVGTCQVARDPTNLNKGIFTCLIGCKCNKNKDGNIAAAAGVYFYNGYGDAKRLWECEGRAQDSLQVEMETYLNTNY